MKIILLTIVAVFLLAPLLTAVPVCGTTCPNQCTSAGQECSEQEQEGPAVNVDGRQLSCVKKQNIGCGFKLDWPFIQGNACPAGLTHDASVDGPEDCGFLGLSAIFGGSTKFCHASQEQTCAANATCSTGFQVQSSSQCSVQQAGAATTVQCCEISQAINLIDEDPPEENVTDYGRVTSIQIQPQDIVIPNGGEIQLTVQGLTEAGLFVDIEEELEWQLTNPLVGNISVEGIFTACENCTLTSEILVLHGPLSASTTVQVLPLTDYRIEPNNVTIITGGRVIFKATALNVLTGEREDVPSTWTTSVGQIAYPSQGQSSYVSLLTTNDEGNGSIQARAGGLRFNASVLVIDSNFTPTELVVDPNPLVVPEGEERLLLITGRDSLGRYGPISAITFNESEFDAVIADRTDDRIKGLSLGDTSINVSSSGLFEIVDIEVTGCTQGTVAECSEGDEGYSASAGYQTRTCQADGSWQACVNVNSCDDTPAPTQGLADGVVCSNWCQTGASDPDCACTGSSSILCTDSLTSCWGSMTCGGSVYGACNPSPSCTGGLVSGTVVGSSLGLFNGFICGTTLPIPSPLTLSSVSSCTAYGSSAVASITGGEACTVSQQIELILNVSAEPDVAWNSVFIERSGIPGAQFYLTDVSEGGAMLDINDTSTGNIVPVLLQVGQPVNFNARVTLNSVNNSFAFDEAGGLMGKSATLTFVFDDCLFNFREETPD